MQENPESIERCVSTMLGCYNTMLSETDMKGDRIADLNGDECISRDDLKYPRWQSSCQNHAVRYKICSSMDRNEVEDFCQYNAMLGEGLAHEMAHFLGFADEAGARETDAIPEP